MYSDYYDDSENSQESSYSSSNEDEKLNSDEEDTVNSNNESINIDSRPSDAVAISLRSKVPIQIDSNLLATLSIHDTQIITEPNSSLDEEITNTSLSYDDLNNLLNDALVNENYELAAKLRDDISRLKNTNEIK